MNTSPQPRENTAITALAEELATLLQEKSTENASLAFSIGCFLSLMIAIGTAILLTLLVHWVTGVLAGLIVLLLALSVTAMLATRAHARRAETALKNEIRPRIEAAARELSLTIPELEAQLRAALPTESLLRRLLLPANGAQR